VSTDLVKDGATAIESLGDAIDASMADLKGGTTGQVLAKNSNTDMDFIWVTDAAGDITNVSVTSPITGGGSSGSVTIGIDSTAVVPSQSGQSGKYLTTNGTASSWATVSADKTLSLIASGTLSGSSLTLSSLSTYDDIVVMFVPFNLSAAAQIRCRINNDSSAKYYAFGTLVQEGSTTTLHWLDAATQIDTYETLKSGYSNSNLFFRFQNCKSASGFTNFNMQGTFLRNSTSANMSQSYQGVYEVAGAVSSLVFAPTSGTFSAGGYRVYGA
jgi:hypothetical protein